MYQKLLGHHHVFSINLDWPKFDDGLNARWSTAPGSLSPVEKYAAAFKLNPSRLADSISKVSGVLSSNWNKPCTKQSDCADLIKNKCSIRRGKSSGYCVPEWFGICRLFY